LSTKKLKLFQKKTQGTRSKKKKWARRDSKQYDQNRVGDTENKENDNTHKQGGAKCAPFENKSEQVAQLLQAFQELTQDERNALLQALGGGGQKSTG